jgi:hypothetical protein
MFWPVTKKERKKIEKALEQSGIERDDNMITIQDGPVTYYVKLDNLKMLKYVDRTKL